MSVGEDGRWSGARDSGGGRDRRDEEAKDVAVPVGDGDWTPRGSAGLVEQENHAPVGLDDPGGPAAVHVHPHIEEREVLRVRHLQVRPDALETEGGCGREIVEDLALAGLHPTHGLLRCFGQELKNFLVGVVVVGCVGRRGRERGVGAGTGLVGVGREERGGGRDGLRGPAPDGEGAWECRATSQY